MRLMMRIGLALAVAAALAAPIDATERRPLPAFSVTPPGGAEAIDTQALVAPAGRTWLLIYVRERCDTCDRLLSHLDRDERPQAARITVIVGGATPDALAALAVKYPNLSAARWFADVDGSAALALRIDSLPVSLGVRGQMIEWGLTGVLKDPSELESVLFAWLER